MRIISQNGMNDYPYEQCMIFVNYKERTKLCISMCGDGADSEFPLGTYDSEEDALYVMECIRYNKKKGYDYFHMPSADDVSTWRQNKGGEL